IAYAILPSATFTSGMTTIVFSPSLDAYAAAEAEVFPVEAQMTVCAPSSFAFATASTIPRSLNEPVGFKPSNLAKALMLYSSLSEFNGINGVLPSCNDNFGVFSVTGKYSLNSSSKPFQYAILLISYDRILSCDFQTAERFIQLIFIHFFSDCYNIV